MARAAVLDLLQNDAPLNAIGGTGFVVVAQYSYDQRPNDKGPFIVIVWRTTDFAVEIQANGLQYFDVYVHIPIAVSTDFGRIDEILDQVDAIFNAIDDNPPIVGGDGQQLDHIGYAGRSPDLSDEDYETICRYASYMALSSKID